MKEDLRKFHEFGSVTERSFTAVPELKLEIETFTNEFWTSAQRACHSLHEISYRACFKPQLPAFFIRRLTRRGDVVYDPFMGRGTTPLEAALSGRVPAGCDVNPLSAFLLAPRLAPPSPRELEERLRALDLSWNNALPEELLVFYHEETLRELCALREYFRSHSLDGTDAWLRMVALNRLTGHSTGFFSVYTLPPNQAVSVDSQRKINEKRRQTPPRRDVKAHGSGLEKTWKTLPRLDSDRECRQDAPDSRQCRLAGRDLAAVSGHCGLPAGQLAPFLVCRH